MHVVVTNAKPQHVLLMPLTWKNDVRLTMEPTCPCVTRPTGKQVRSGRHAHIEHPERSRAWSGGQTCREAENYGVVLAKHLVMVKAIMDDEALTQQIYAVDDAETGTLRQLATAHGTHAARVAHRLHRNLGHPRKEVLLKLLEGKQVSEKAREAIQSLHCPHCQNYGIKKGVCPRYMAARIVSDEKSPLTDQSAPGLGSMVRCNNSKWMNMLDGDLMHLQPRQKTMTLSSRFLLDKSIQERALLRDDINCYGVLFKSTWMTMRSLEWMPCMKLSIGWCPPSTGTPLRTALHPHNLRWVDSLLFEPGLMSEECTKPPQLSEGQHLQEILKSVSISSPTSMCQS